MTKKRSRFLFVLFTIILVILLLATFLNFTYPLSINGNYYSYTSFLNGFRLGGDIGNSVRIVYITEKRDAGSESEIESLRLSTINEIKEILNTAGYLDATVVPFGDKDIEVQVGATNKKDVDTINNLIGAPTDITFSTEKDGEAFADGSKIKKIWTTTFTNAGEIYYPIIVEFKDEYLTDLIDKFGTQDSPKTVYFNFGSFTNLTWDNGLVNGAMQINFNNTVVKSIDDANMYANQMKAGMLTMKLTADSFDTITASFGNHTDILLLIACVIVVVSSFVYLIVKYRELGLLAVFNLLFFICFSLFILQSIPLFTLNFSGVLGLIIVYFLIVDCLVSIFEKAKFYYLQDTKLNIALKMALNDTLYKLLFIHALILVCGLIAFLMPQAGLSSFGWTCVVLPIISGITTLGLMRLFVNMYIAFNKQNGKRCNFHKGGKNA